VVLKYLGQLCLVAAVLTFVPLFASLIWGEYAISVRYGIVAVRSPRGLSSLATSDGKKSHGI